MAMHEPEACTEFIKADFISTNIICEDPCQRTGACTATTVTGPATLTIPLTAEGHTVPCTIYGGIPTAPVTATVTTNGETTALGAIIGATQSTVTLAISVPQFTAATQQTPEVIVKTAPPPPTSTNTYVCEVCGKAFAKHCSLTMHKRMHSGHRQQVICNACGKAFASSSFLLLHKCIHADSGSPDNGPDGKVDKPFTCPDCGRAFPQASDVTAHSRVHTGDRPHVCSSCGKAFKVRKPFLELVKRFLHAVWISLYIKSKIRAIILCICLFVYDLCTFLPVVISMRKKLICYSADIWYRSGITEWQSLQQVSVVHLTSF